MLTGQGDAPRGNLRYTPEPEEISGNCGDNGKPGGWVSNSAYSPQNIFRHQPRFLVTLTSPEVHGDGRGWTINRYLSQSAFLSHPALAILNLSKFGGARRGE